MQCSNQSFQPIRNQAQLTDSGAISRLVICILKAAREDEGQISLLFSINNSRIKHDRIEMVHRNESSFVFRMS